MFSYMILRHLHNVYIKAFIIILQESNLELDPVNGASKCIRCRPCKDGYFSNVHAYKCKKCTNCTLLNKVEVQSCSISEDSHCSSQV